MHYMTVGIYGGLLGLVYALICLFLSGCSITPEAQLAIANRQVELTVYGIYGVSDTGAVIGIGYFTYRRNLPNAEPSDKPSNVVK